MKKLILAAVLLAGTALATTARADIVEPDPLHGACTGCTHVTIGGNDVTLLGPGGVTNFGFTSSPPGGTGDLQLKFLIPTSYGLAAVQAYAAANTVTGTSSSALSLYSATPWTSGFLETDYLNNTLANGAPKNPLDAWLGATQTLQPTANGYFLLTAAMGPYVLGGQSDPLSNTFSLSSGVYFEGGLIAGNLFTANGVISTAQSSALFSATPVPGPIVGAGLPGLLSACFGLFGLNYWRKRRTGATLPA